MRYLPTNSSPSSISMRLSVLQDTKNQKNFTKYFCFFKKNDIIITLIEQQAGESTSLQKEIPSTKGDFFDYRPRIISNTILALQKERDRTIFIRMKGKAGGE